MGRQFTLLLEYLKVWDVSLYDRIALKCFPSFNGFSIQMPGEIHGICRAFGLWGELLLMSSVAAAIYSPKSK